jgi:hypothetical protein
MILPYNATPMPHGTLDGIGSIRKEIVRWLRRNSVRSGGETRDTVVVTGVNRIRMPTMEFLIVFWAFPKRALKSAIPPTKDGAQVANIGNAARKPELVLPIGAGHERAVAATKTVALS